MAEGKRKRRESFGAIRKLPSGRFQASYIGSDAARHSAPKTFDNQTDARAWLARQRVEMMDGDWKVPRKLAPVAFGEYAREHIATRVNSRGEPLKPRTAAEYVRLLDGPLREFQAVGLPTITSESVRRWFSRQVQTGRRTQAARAYRLLASVLTTAVEDGRLRANPCQIRGATKASSRRTVKPPTDAELAIIVASIDPRLSMLSEVAAWGGLRWGELTELRKSDVEFIGDVATLSVTRAVTYVKARGFIIGSPKSAAGVRSVALPASLAIRLRVYMAGLRAADDALLFPSLSDDTRHLSSGSFSKPWRAARASAGRDDMPFHALRHYGATRYVLAGAMPREVMRRMGHTDISVAMRYQHEVGRDAELADRMSTL